MSMAIIMKNNDLHEFQYSTVEGKKSLNDNLQEDFGQ